MHAVKLKSYITLVRPFTLLAPFVATLCSIVMSMIVHGEIHRLYHHWGVVLAAAMAMALSQMCGQIINQAEDPVELDILNGKSHRPIPQNKVTKSRARQLGYTAGIVALASAFIIDLSFGIGITLLLFFAIFYSVEPLRIKKRKIVNALWLGLSRGLLPILASWSLLYSPFEILPIVLSLVLFFWVTGFQITKDFPDIPGDRQFGILTIPVVYGIDHAKRFMHWMNGLAFGTLLMALITRILPVSFVIALVLFPVSVFVIHGIHGNPEKHRAVENTPEWMFFYIGLAFHYVLFTIALVIR